MGAQMQRGAYSRVCGAATAKRPAALGYAGAGPAQGATGAPSHVRAAGRQDPKAASEDPSQAVLTNKKILSEWDWRWCP